VLHRARISVAIVAVFAALVAMTAPALASGSPARAQAGATWRVAYRLHGRLFGVIATGRGNAWAWALVHGRWQILHWNGSHWRILRVLPASFHAEDVAASSASNLLVLGFTKATGLPKLLHFDGHSWTTMPLPPESIGDFVVRGPSDVWASMDTFWTQAAGWETNLAHWNGSSWTTRTVPVRSSGTSDMARSPARGLWLAGTTAQNTSAAPGRGKLVAYRWNGHAWTWVHMPHPQITGWPQIAMSADSEVWIRAQGPRGQTFVLHRTTSGHWQRIPAPKRSAGPLAAAGPDRLWLAGHFVWNGHRWLTANPPLYAGSITGVPGTGSAWMVLDPGTVIDGLPTNIYVNGRLP
jgi:hypothetical protein